MLLFAFGYASFKLPHSSEHFDLEQVEVNRKNDEMDGTKNGNEQWPKVGKLWRWRDVDRCDAQNDEAGH